MGRHFTTLEQGDASAPGEFADSRQWHDFSALADGEALCILKAMNLNNFQNPMNTIGISLAGSRSSIAIHRPGNCGRKKSFDKRFAA